MCKIERLEVGGKIYANLSELQQELRCKNPLFYKPLKDEILAKYPQIEFADDYGACRLELTSSDDSIASDSTAMVEDESKLSIDTGTVLRAILAVSSRTLANNPKVATDGFRLVAHSFFDLHTITSHYHYSNTIFKDGHRAKANVQGFGNLLIADIDNKVGTQQVSQYSIDEVKELLAPFNFLIATTQSHTDTWQKFRVILAFDDNMPSELDDDDYKYFTEFCFEFIGFDTDKLDKACFGSDRQYAPNRGNQQHHYGYGQTLQLQTLLEVCTDTYIDREATKILLAQLQSQTTPQISNGYFGLSREDNKAQRNYLKALTTAYIAKEILQESPFNYSFNGFTMKIDDNKTKAVKINPHTGALTDFGNNQSHDIASILMDRFGYSFFEAIAFWETKLIDKGILNGIL
jgi:hypothetical protein